MKYATSFQTQFVSKIPDFWLDVLKHSPVGNLIEEWDEDVLKYLMNIRQFWIGGDLDDINRTENDMNEDELKEESMNVSKHFLAYKTEG